MTEKIYQRLPAVFQNGLVTLFDVLQYRKRHSGNYTNWFKYYESSRNQDLPALQKDQMEKLFAFVNFAARESAYYKQIFVRLGLTEITTMEQFFQLPIQSKEDIRANIESVYTISKKQAILSKTGGTTGKSLEVRFTYDDMQNRFAMLDFFRFGYGYKLGSKVAWFSGKSLLTAKDVVKNRYWKYDWKYRIRYYSTFHINAHTARHYIDDFNQFQPLYAVGFPSSIYEIAKWGLANNYKLSYNMRAVFPTAETVMPHERKVIEAFFGGPVVNQYASSEGAPFIIECEKGKLHMELLTGYMEVLDDRGQPAKEGELVFTSFTTHGTPLIRYAIKDKIRLSADTCTCGNHNPVVESIQGRINDFVYSEERGKINLGNISNCVKYVKGVVKFQIIQNAVDYIQVKIVRDNTFTDKDEKMFLHELKERLGNKMNIDITYVKEIPREASGKYRIVKQGLTV
jgi:phenylacetate-CoA ligase